MNKEQIIAMQARIGTTPDGFWGAKSIAACQKHLRAMMPEKNPWPKADFESMVKFYGHPGESNLESLNVEGMGVEYDGKPVASIRCHSLVVISLRNIIREISQSPHKAILKQYAGCYNFRKMRGGNSYSKHAWGVAIDLDPGNNGNNTHWPTKATMPLEVCEAFAKECWLSAGVFWSRDGMHHEATR